MVSIGSWARRPYANSRPTGYDRKLRCDETPLSTRRIMPGPFSSQYKSTIRWLSSSIADRPNVQKSGSQCVRLAMQRQLHFGRVARQGSFALMSLIQRSEQTGRDGPISRRRCLLRYITPCRDCCKKQLGI